jgi:adenylosuccinate synthase
LDAFGNLNICTSYKINGKESKQVPFQMTQCTIEPQYESFQGWGQETSQIKDVAKLPDEMKSYIDFINNNLSAKVHYISNGPGRDQIVKVY